MTTAKLFKNGRSQAVRIPKEFRFEGVKEVSLRREGKAVILEPVEEFSWNKWWESWQALGDDFMPEGRRQLPMQKRNLDFA
jgi:antitoxin VapB